MFAVWDLGGNGMAVNEELGKVDAAGDGMSTGQQDKSSNNTKNVRGWVCVIAVTICGVIVMMEQYKANPVMHDLIMQWGGSFGSIAWLSTVYALTGMLLAIPISVVLNKIGPKFTGMIGLALAVIGCALGAMSTTYVQMLITRIIEGCGVSLMGVVGPTVVSMHFGREKASVPMCIWNMWYAGGSFAAYNLAGPVMEALGGTWQSWWWFCDALALVAFLIMTIFVTKPKGEAVVKKSGPDPEEGVKLFDGFKCKRIWVLSLGFCFLMFTSLGFLSWAPTYFQNVGWCADVASAGSLSAIGFSTSIPASIVCAFVMWKVKSRKGRNIMLIVCAAYELALYPWCFLVPQEFIVPYLCLCGLGTGFTAGCCWGAVPVTMPFKKTIPLGMAMMTMFKNVANLIAQPIVGYAVNPAENVYQWANAVPIQITAALIALTLIIIYVRMKPETFAEDRVQ